MNDKVSIDKADLLHEISLRAGEMSSESMKYGGDFCGATCDTDMITVKADREQVLDLWSKSRDKKLADSSLRDLASLKAFIDYQDPPVSEGLVYAAALGTSVGNLRKVNDAVGAFKGRILCYALAQVIKGGDKKSPYAFSQVVAQVYGKDIALPTGFESLQHLQIALKDFVNVPSSFTQVVKAGAEKFIFALNPTPSGNYLLELTYANGREAAVNAFLRFIEQVIKDNNFYRGHAITLDGQFLDIADVDWKDWFGEEGLRDSLLGNIKSIFDKEAVLLANGVNAKRGIIISGPPGTGKTLFAKCLANELRGKVTFIWVTPKDVGWAERVKQLYELAQDLAPAIVFLEDADMYLADRSYSNNNPILGELMQCLDGFIPLHGVVTILTSNRPEVLEGALSKRPGRFDINYFLGPPSPGVRAKMLAHLFGRINLPAPELEWLVKQCDGFTGAELKNVYEYAVISATDRGAVDKYKVAHPDHQDLAHAVETMLEMKGSGQIEIVIKTVDDEPASSCGAFALPLPTAIAVRQAAVEPDPGEDDDPGEDEEDDFGDEDVDESVAPPRKCFGSRVQVRNVIPVLKENNYEDR